MQLIITKNIPMTAKRQIKKADRITQEIKKIVIDTSKSTEKKSSNELLQELRYGK